MFNLSSVGSPRRWEPQDFEMDAPKPLYIDLFFTGMKAVEIPPGYSIAQSQSAVENIRPMLEGLLSVCDHLLPLEWRRAIFHRGLELRDEELRKNFEPCQDPPQPTESRVAVCRNDGQGRVFVGWRIFKDGKEVLPEGVTDDR